MKTTKCIRYWTAGPQTKIGRVRAGQIVRVLRNLPAEVPGAGGQAQTAKFHMGTWFEQHPACGTTACAIGWSALDPWHMKQGLRLQMGLAPAPRFSSRGDFLGFDAVERYLGISYHTATLLFLLSAYAPGADGPLDVADRIEKWLIDGVITVPFSVNSERTWDTSALQGTVIDTTVTQGELK